ncbi:DUF418 domain-containing protein [Fulvivirga lutea]|uniref:DUF418 domain-containing protein n=1 Tax=Fulvivirga lutea TaxID=2810512 RepID=A0A975A200_9BACT|nr:DUF418 domain-containing protein [Fulvivirga lutea]QSE98366.1 DUF418 domain-containing protein [Fulvivirga lutea]
MTSVQNKVAAPIAEADRIEILDILRGFALFGILIMNIINFSGYDFASDATKSSFSTYRIDQHLLNLARMFFEGKFYAIFSILFGIGFSIIMMRLKSKTSNWKALFYRRLLILALIGYIHLQFLWAGDILLVYALMGFLLPLFANYTDRNLLIVSVSLLVLAIVIHVFVAITGFMPGQWLENIGLMIDSRNGIPEDESWRTYLFNSAHGWQEFWKWNVPGPLFRFSDLINSNRFFKILSLFLLGYYIGRRQFALYLEADRLIIKKITIYGFLMGIPSNLAYVYFYNDGIQLPEPLGLLDSVFQIVGGFSLGLAIMGGLTIAYFNGHKWLMWFAPMGKMALTNYLMQTIICIGLFYCIAFALGGKMGLTYIYLITVGIILFQMLYSKVWLKYYRYGPMEWLWRKLTYGRLK